MLGTYNMTSLIQFYTHDGHYIDQILSTISLTDEKDGLGKATFTLSVNNTKASEQLIKPGNFVVIEDENLKGGWIGVIVPPTSVNNKQITLGITDPRYLLMSIPILDTDGLGVGVEAAQAIKFAVKSTKVRQSHRFSYSPKENVWKNSTSKIRKDGVEHLGRDIYSYLNLLADFKNFEWWIEHNISHAGILSLKIRTANLRRTRGNPIYIPAHGKVSGLGLTYTNRYYTAIAVINTRGNTPKFIKYIPFDNLIEEFGTVVLVVEKSDFEDRDTSISSLFRQHRPRRTISLDLDVTKVDVINSLEIGSTHRVVLGDIGFTDDKRGTDLYMRTIGISYNSGQSTINIVLKEFFGKDDPQLAGTE